MINMKAKIKNYRAIFGVLVILLSITIITIGSSATMPVAAEMWTVEDEECRAALTVSGSGDTTYTTGHIRHCLLQPVEQCNSHACRSDFILE